MHRVFQTLLFRQAPNLQMQPLMLSNLIQTTALKYLLYRLDVVVNHVSNFSFLSNDDGFLPAQSHLTGTFITYDPDHATGILRDGQAPYNVCCGCSSSVVRRIVFLEPVDRGVLSFFLL